ncbi:MAG: hypothetical protein R3F48_13580 [Candidatus Zixiibacteriota bacterium]
MKKAKSGFAKSAEIDYVSDAFSEVQVDFCSPLLGKGKTMDNKEFHLRSHRTGLIKNTQHSQLLRILDANPEDSEVQSLVLEALESAETQNQLDPDPFRPTNPAFSDGLHGRLLLGKVSNTNSPWLIEPDMLTNSILICGRSGGGKTNFILLILAQILEMNQ